MNQAPKQALIVLAAIAVASFVGGGIYFLVTKAEALDRDSKQAAQDLFTKVAGQWRYADLDKVADEGLLQAVSKKDLEKLLAAFRKKLGPLKEILSCEGEAMAFLGLGGTKSSITAKYELKVRFAKGEGTASMKLKRVYGQWMLLGLHLNSPLLVE